MITAEGHQLGLHWSCYGPKYLDSYLIQNVEHPAINPQSVLTRAFVVDRLVSARFETIIEDELLFAACACHALQQHSKGRLSELLKCIQQEPPHAELPRFLSPDFLSRQRCHIDLKQLIMTLGACITLGFDWMQSPFEKIWSRALADIKPAGERMLEVGCGSANDYRFWDRYGIARLIDYTGIDVCATNVSNAQTRFPNARFRLGDACSIDEADGTFKVVFCFDLLEHLSEQAIGAAMSEFERLSQDEIWISTFNAGPFANHQIRPVDGYHWNTLSLCELSQHLNDAGFAPEIVSVSAELERRFCGYHHYNQNAYILIGRRHAIVGNS